MMLPNKWILDTVPLSLSHAKWYNLVKIFIGYNCIVLLIYPLLKSFIQFVCINMGWYFHTLPYNVRGKRRPVNLKKKFN